MAKSWYPSQQPEEPEDHDAEPNEWLDDPTQPAERGLPRRGEAHDEIAETPSPFGDNPYAEQPLAGPWGDGSPQETLAGDYPVIANTPTQGSETETDADRSSAHRGDQRSSSGCLFLVALLGLSTSILAARAKS
ncbi:hypothetical protein [Auritidibacter ignavus]|uniref:hypothetical protein n=1 Tax=Auritidibacter ignavus TaxID=678932 RepID=UPI0011C4261F|nr:hypothetical protein [Auritidibacter ignavus]NIH72563.1 hypothetical protein [Auritidibacter ignavus]